MSFSQVCNHPDLFEPRQIDSPLVMMPLDLSIGTQLLRSPLRFPEGVGGVGDEWGGGGGGDWDIRSRDRDWSSSDAARVVSPRLLSPLWAHDLSSESVH